MESCQNWGPIYNSHGYLAKHFECALSRMLGYTL